MNPQVTRAVNGAVNVEPSRKEPQHQLNNNTPNHAPSPRNDKDFNISDYRAIARIVFNNKSPSDDHIDELQAFFRIICVQKMSDLDYQNGNDLIDAVELMKIPQTPSPASSFRGACRIRLRKFLDYGAIPGILMSPDLTLKTIQEVTEERRRLELQKQKLMARTFNCHLCETRKRINEKLRQEMLYKVKVMRHSADCVDSRCTEWNCSYMKKTFRHVPICRRRAEGGCKRCKDFEKVREFHVKRCKNAACLVPLCKAMRRRARQA